MSARHHSTDAPEGDRRAGPAVGAPRGRRRATLGALTLAALGLTLSACATPAAPSKDRSVLVRVVTYPRARSTAQALARHAYLRLQTQEAGVALRAQALTETTRQTPASEARAQALTALQRARDEYRKLRFHQALETLAGPLALLPTLAVAPDDHRLLAALLLRGALCELALSRAEAARASIAKAIHLGFEQATAGEYSPEVEAVIDEVRQALARGKPRRLRATTRPAGAVIAIDGKRLGPTPLKLELLPGPHLVRAEHHGFYPKTAWWTVRPAAAGEAQQRALILAPLAPADAARALLAELDARRDRSADDPSADPALLASVLGPARAVITRTGSAPALNARLLWTGTPEAAPAIRACSGANATALAACLGPELYALASGQQLPAQRRSHAGARPFYRRWWFWALVAAGAGGATAGIWLGARDPSGVNLDFRPAR
ncbi:MAG: PEGA domain-containing protein [Proteobacteria bacterium]|nr:PEGA domain-containing protein [Pseudomonadota bacterium]